MRQLFIINPLAGKADASVVLVPQIQAAAATPANWPKPPQPAGKKYISTRQAATAR